MKSIRTWTKPIRIWCFTTIGVLTALGVSMLFGCATMKVTNNTKTDQLKTYGVSFYNYGYVYDVNGMKISDLRDSLEYSAWLKSYVNQVIIPLRAEADAKTEQLIIDYCNTFIKVSDTAYSLLITGATLASVFGTIAVSLGVWWTLDSKKISMKKQ